MPRRLLLIALVSAFSTLAARARAGGADYERALIERGLRAKNLAHHPNPAAERITCIEIYREEIVAKSDPWPDLINIVHVKTGDQAVRQELLVAPGQLYDAARVAESERNLRSLTILGVARIVPAREAGDDDLVLLVVTKDLWSLRLNMLFNQTGALVTDMTIRPTEMNFLGRNKQVGLLVAISWLELHAAIPYWLSAFSIGRVVRDRVVVGQHYLDPRVLGTRLALLEQVQIHLEGHVPCGGAIGEQAAGQPLWCPDRSAGSISGVLAQLELARPLFSLATPWAFSLRGTVELRPVRFFQQNPTSAADPPAGERRGVTLEALAFDHPDGTKRYVPHVYERTFLLSQLEFTRSFGQALKHDLTWGLLAYRIANEAPGSFPFDETTKRWYAGFVLPRSEAASALVLRYGIRPTRFIKLHELRTFAVTEDYGLGPALRLETRLATDLVRSSTPFVEILGSARYRWHLSQDLLTLQGAFTTRYQPGLAELQGGLTPELRQELGDWLNNRLELSLENAFPPLWIGRFHLFAALVLREDDLDRGFSRLGGSGTSATTNGVQDNDNVALRGYLSAQFVGRNLLRVHAEYRTRSFSLFTVHCGAVLFYDGGSAWGRLGPGRQPAPFGFHQSVGLGLRALIPQLDRESFRLDFGVPLDTGGSGSLETWFSFSFGQAF